MKNNIRSFATPILLLLLGILAFGLQSLWLGYTLDDWVVLYHIFRGGYERLAEYSLAVNRPYGAWPWWIGFSLIGYSPIGWHIWSLAWRLTTVILLWKGWRLIFPDKAREITMASALFLVYPIFVQQTAAVTFSDHWMCFALYALSIVIMAFATSRPKWFWPLTGLGLAASGLQLFTIEYFVGLELIRPLLLWYQFREVAPLISRLKKTALHELPYGLLLGAFLTWRFFFMPSLGADRNRPELLVDLYQKPLQTLVSFSLEALQDVVEALVGTWYKTYNPATITSTPPAHLLGWGITAAAFGLGLFFCLYFLKEETKPVDKTTPRWGWITVNILTMIAGLLPGWVVGAQLVTVANYSDRFGLAAMFGASLLIVSAAGEWLKPRNQIILISLLIALGTGYHFRLSNEYRWRWEVQSRLAWQLTWRMPGLKPNTAIYGDGILTNGSWVDIAWINFLFSAPGSQSGDDYWYFDLNKYNAGDLPLPDIKLSEKRLEHLSFQGNTSDSLVIQFKSVPNQCLWVIRQGESNPVLNPLVKEVSGLSNPTRIDLAAGQNINVSKVFLPAQADQWCYYFEKAQLAVENEQWSQVKALWQEVEAKKLKTSVGWEYLPFVHGVAMTGDIDTAVGISQLVIAVNPLMREPICQTWKTITDDSTKAGRISNQEAGSWNSLQCQNW